MSEAVSSTGILVRRRGLPAAPITITSSSVAAASLITTAAPHGRTSGDSVTIAGHAGSTPAVAGDFVITVLSPTTFTIPLTVTVAGTGGTATPGYTDVAEITSVGPGGKSRNKKETSTHNSGKESYVLGILRQKDPTFKINVVGGNASHEAINDDLDNNVKSGWQIAFPSGRTRTGEGFVQAMEYDDAPVDGVEGASITLTWAGEVVEAFA